MPLQFFDLSGDNIKPHHLSAVGLGRDILIPTAITRGANQGKHTDKLKNVGD